jgi:methylmalonyl-CoA decarboxylase
MSDDTANPVSVEMVNDIAAITMNDPARRNALGGVMLSGLQRAFEAASTQHMRAVILRAAPGTTVWCAGFDIDDLAVGRDLALRCDIAVATPACTLAFTPARLGLPYDPDGLLNVLLRCGLNLAIEMFATGNPVAADRALRAGLLNHIVPEAEIDGFVRTMAERIAANAPLSVNSAKAQLRALNAAMPISAATMQALLETRQRALDSADFGEGLAAFRGKRQPRFVGR